MSVIQQFIKEIDMAAAQPVANVVSFREARAKRIRELTLRWGDDTIQLGKELIAARDTFPVEPGSGATFTRPGWNDWLRENTGFSPKQTQAFIRVAEKFEVGMADIGLSHTVLELLARDKVPDEARKEVVERAKSGEVVGRKSAKQIVDKHKAPPPEEARKIAKETGKPTLARDGNIYLGATKEEGQQIEARREMVFGVRRAIEALATVGITPAKFLKQALPHQLWTAEEEHLIDEAYEWLGNLKSAWEER